MKPICKIINIDPDFIEYYSIETGRHLKVWHGKGIEIINQGSETIELIDGNGNSIITAIPHIYEQYTSNLNEIADTYSGPDKERWKNTMEKGSEGFEVKFRAKIIK